MGLDLERELNELRQNEQDILSRIRQRDRSKTIGCACCKKLHRISEVKAIQTHHYIEAHGCTQGDYWNPGELQFICPKTGVINRLLFVSCNIPSEERDVYENDAERQFKDRYRSLFLEVEDSYKTQVGAIWMNNHYVDNNRAKFGLVAKKRR